MKECNKCHKLYSIDNFYSSKGNPDDKTYSCKFCISKLGKEKYKVNKNKFIERSKRWANKNKEYRREYRKEYNKKNKRKISEYNKKYRITEKGKLIRRELSTERERKLKFIPLIENPFPEDIELDWHHINNLLVVPIPRITHKYNHRGQHINKHREECKTWINKIYCIDIDKLLSENLE
jgi:hypothetical protein